MSYGFETYNSNGSVAFSTNDTVWNVVASFVVPTNSAGSFSLPEGYTLFSEFKIITAPYEFITPEHDSSKCIAWYAGSGVVGYGLAGIGTTVASLVIVLGR
jgi:hypothetical protein